MASTHSAVNLLRATAAAAATNSSAAAEIAAAFTLHSAPHAMGKQEQLAAFTAFDFEGSAAWQAHLCHSIELPASASANAAALLRVKAKWFKKAVDPDFDITWVTGQPAAAPPPAPAPAAAAPPPQQQQAAQPQQQPPPVPRSAQWQAQRRFHGIVLNTLVLLFAALYLATSFFNRSLSRWAYGKCMLVLLASHALKIHSSYGTPVSWRSWAAVKAWLARVMASSDGQYAALALTAAGNAPQCPLLVPFVVAAAYALGGALQESGWSSHRLWQQHGAPLYAKMAAHRPAVQEHVAQSEVFLGFWMIFTLIWPGRAPLLAYMVWHFLRARYWSPDSALQHRRVWALLDHYTAPTRQQVSLLAKLVSFGQNFFHQQQARA